VTTLLDRFRVAQLLDLSIAERTLTGPERAVREEEVALLIKAAFDAASEPAREAFMARVKQLPAANWPWSAVSSAPGVITIAPPGAGFKAFVKPKPGTSAAPALMLLFLGQVPNDHQAPGNELPTRGTTEGFLFEPLYQAIDAWDTTAIRRWIGPQGWASGAGGSTGTGTGNDTGTSTGGSLPANTSEVPPFWRSKPVVVGAAVVATSLTLLTVIRLGRLLDSSDRLEAQLRSGARP
jgi:hypothetical protein